MTDLLGARTGFADVNGARLYYEMAGSGPAVALLHFGLGDSRSWDEQFAALAERYTVVRYDYRGVGRSSMPPDAYSPRGDLEALLSALGLGRVALVGVSMGGGLAMDFTLEHPTRVTTLVVVGASPSGLALDEETAAALSRLFAPVEEAERAGDLERASDLEVSIWVDGPGRSADQGPAAVRERVRRMNLENWRRQAAEIQGTVVPLEPPAAARLGEIGVPTLVIVGDEDLPDIVGAADIIAGGIPGARKVVMRGTAHAPHMEKPEEFNSLVLDFLAAQHA
jgi:pimeloyl-ACP methyl ester carboxylesterase